MQEFIVAHDLTFLESCRSSRMQYKTGTTKTLIIATNIPPNEGIAMGIMMSDPRPEEVITGSRAINVVADVISAGFIRLVAAAVIVFRNSSTFAGVSFFSR